ncbi:MAG: hydantoinase/oxoprolinase N-terminal domain-containing protein [Granulosicoccus sp.]
MGLQLGLDTGGTFTDAVLLDDDLKVRNCAKSLTTHHDLIQGLRGAVEQVVRGQPVEQINRVCLSTTLATNALVEGRGRSVALVLIGFRESQLQRANLSDALAGDPILRVSGGHQASGAMQDILDVNAIKAFVSQVDSRVDAYAVSGVFAVRNPEHEVQTQALIASLSGKPVACGHHLSSGLDAPRRALTALLNARLIPMINALLDAARDLMDETGIKAPLMVVKGDGSLISDSVASQYPVETILSGPAASVVGAQYLCAHDDLLVSDMGGTTTDIALIRSGQPLLSVDGATVGGWRTMVKAVDVRTYGLGGDSAVQFDRGLRRLCIGPNRVVPLSLLVQQYPDCLAELEAQLTLPMSTTHSGQFVLLHAASPTDLTSQQQELYEQIAKGPVALQSLFAAQTLERALHRLEQRGVVIRAGFTPTDACHITGDQTTWPATAAMLGARLLMRYSEDNLGTEYASEQQFANEVQTRVSELTSLALIGAISAVAGAAITTSQQELIERSFRRTAEAGFSLKPQLQVTLVGLGAPAASYYQGSANLLNTDLNLPEFAHVANALGAVVGSIRQEQLIVINPAGGERVSVLFPEGPVEYDSLEEGAQAAIARASELATEKARLAGALYPALTVNRADNIVNNSGENVFFESCISVTATGRPASAI